METDHILGRWALELADTLGLGLATPTPFGHILWTGERWVVHYYAPGVRRPPLVRWHGYLVDYYCEGLPMARAAA